MHIRLITLLLAALPLLANAAIYYVSPTGNDSNNGTSQSTPWRTISRVQQLEYNFQPGDQVLFQRGGVYPGQLNIGSSGTSSLPIVLGAYGTGALPEISGANPVTGWTVHSGNIWRAPVSQAVKHVRVNGALMTLARYPNTGWLTVNTSSATNLNCPSLTQSSGYWNGGRLVIRSTNWCYETADISASSSGNLTFSALTYNPGNFDWGFFLCNKLSQLDAAGEWFHDAAAGMLYLWAPSNANPNSTTVYASVYENGVNVGWQRNYIRVQDLAFRGQTYAGVNQGGGANLTVTGCTFQYCNHAIRSYGNYDTYSNNTVSNTFATGMALLDNNSLIENNILTDIAMYPGLGESVWGYYGMYAMGNTNTVRGNRITRTGNSGIFLMGSPLVEKNVIRQALSTVSDGGGIYWDNGNGMTIQDNIVSDLVCNMESVAPDYQVNYKIGHGIYFGNAVIQNTIVRRNTVYNCPGAGIHVDHTMVTSGNQIRDNILFDNDVQMSFSDYSNYNGPGATPPYFVPTYNTAVSGNIMYCLTKDQLCMQYYNCHSPTTVDFGTFTNNKYYNPYNELNIFHHNLNTYKHRFYTMERWQTERSEEAGSTRSPLRLEAYSTTSELTGNLVINGTFASNVSGWGGWPTNAIVTRDLTYLDAGALKAHLPNNSQDIEFYLRSPDQFSSTNGQWYRMRFSVQSNIHGIVRAGVKGASQLSGPNMIYERSIPFDTQRRDMEMYFQSNLTDQALAHFVNSYTEPQYWLDNIDVRRVNAAPIDPALEHLLYANDQATAQSYTLPTGCWSDMTGTVVSSPVTVQPYASKVLYRVTGAGCGVVQAASVGVKVLLGGAMNWGTGLMRDNLRTQSLIPTAEPYTAMGLTLENPAATVSSALLQTTGALAIVDWVVVELRNNVAGYTLAGRRAALLRANGTVVATDGSALVPFNVPTIGKYLVLRHRNHLSAMAATPIATNGQLVDLTLSATAMYGTTPLQVVGSERGLWPGEVTMDGTVRYTGQTNDRDPVLVAIGSSVPSNTVQGYNMADVNMDGWSKYVGSGNDRDFILTTIGGSVPTVTRVAQVP